VFVCRLPGLLHLRPWRIFESDQPPEHDRRNTEHRTDDGFNSVQHLCREKLLERNGCSAKRRAAQRHKRLPGVCWSGVPCFDSVHVLLKLRFARIPLVMWADDATRKHRLPHEIPDCAVHLVSEIQHGKRHVQPAQTRTPRIRVDVPEKHYLFRTIDSLAVLRVYFESTIDPTVCRLRLEFTTTERNEPPEPPSSIELPNPQRLPSH